MTGYEFDLFNQYMTLEFARVPGFQSLSLNVKPSSCSSSSLVL